MKKSESDKFLNMFGRNLLAIRKAKGISQEQLSFDADISLSSISKIERGILNISVVNVYKIAKALDIHCSELLKFDVVEKSKKT